MNNKKHTFILIGTMVLLFLFALVFENIESKNTASSIDFTNFRKTITLKFESLDNSLKNIKLDFEKQPTQDFVKIEFPKLNNLYNKDKTIVFVYSDDKCILWTNNDVDFSDINLNKEYHNIIKIRNAWYILTSIKFDNNYIAALSIIKHEYDYENEFLHNKFSDDFSLPKNVNISKIKSVEAENIRDENGKFLCSLHTKNTSKKHINWISILLYSLSFILFLFLILNVSTKTKKHNFLQILTVLSIFLIVCFLMIKFQFPKAIYSTELFGYNIYAYSFAFPSLGDFLVNTILFFGLIYLIYIKLPNSINVNKKYHSVVVFLSVFTISSLFLAINFMIQNLILNSSISFELYNVLKLNIYSFIGLLIIALLLASFILISKKLLLISTNISDKKIFILNLSISFVIILLIIQYFNFIEHSYILMLFLFIYISVVSIIHYKNIRFKYYVVVIIVFYLSIYSVFVISNTSTVKEQNIRKVFGVKLANERDGVAELFFLNLNSKIIADSSQILNSFDKGIDNASRYIENKYFNGFWSKYDVQLSVCETLDSLYFEEDDQIINCNEYFNTQIIEQGMQLGNTNFYYINNSNERISYLGSFKFTKDDNTSLSVIFEIDSKLISNELGYPELLLDKKSLKKSNIHGYSYARYKNTKLISQRGNFKYRLNYKFAPKKEFTFVDFDNYNHLLYKIDDDNLLIISKPKIQIIDILISFSYIVVFLYVLFNLSILLANFPINFSTISFSFKNRIQFSIILMLLLSLLLIGTVTIYFFITQFENKNKEILSEKIRSVHVEVSHKLSNERYLSSEIQEYVNSLLIKFSNVFYSDINLYDSLGNLYATSRSEIFDKGLISTKMNSEAYFELATNKKVEFVHQERIGEMNYTSAYIPFRNQKDEFLAYLNLPYFTKHSALKKEISSFIVAIINVYVILILLSIVITVFLSNRITQPLSLLQKRFREMNLQQKNEQITYNGNDEISSLVNEYNRMVEELSESANMLAKSERENAWREMAKQIAHEIKNPLTPMKLSVQFLQHSWKNNPDNWGSLLNKVSNTLIEQINTLSAIASEFSNFAKMPKANVEKINLGDKISSVISLFESTDNVQFTIKKPKDNIYILADKKEILRVFNNLVKNAIQAIPDERKGQIDISLKTDKNYCITRIQDNGQGIPNEIKETLFDPNFTTKSSGMGLGLSIVKRIIENLGGNIIFETELGKGSTFIINIPLLTKL